ncbi:hypothetical protein HPB51_021854 [Rhipicephalus microplus]|uniref:Uncharacterized protein n=1 Tax=Rhipicephalus microplus TaxID=6941 RepID=A0A9J6E3F9_RHIMP|nr:hypothetical protein HPB51_021854 [Rhipicephalus microplus]
MASKTQLVLSTVLALIPTSSISWDEDSTSVIEEGSRASKTASESSASATKSQSESPAVPRNPSTAARHRVELIMIQRSHWGVMSFRTKHGFCPVERHGYPQRPLRRHHPPRLKTGIKTPRPSRRRIQMTSPRFSCQKVSRSLALTVGSWTGLDLQRKPSHSAQRSTRQEQLQRAATSLTEAGPSRDTGTTPETHSRGSSTEDVLFELDAFMAMSVHELLEDEAAKKQTLAWYVTGRRTNTKRACAEEIRKLLVAAARSERAKRRHLSSALRRIVQFQYSLSRLSPDTSPMSQEREKLDDDTDP